MNKRETIEHWKKKIKTNPGWALRAAIRIYQSQTQEEQCSHATLDSNGVGFNSFDSPVISPIVDRYLRTKVIEGKSIYQLQRRMPKYAGQLYKIVGDTNATRND